jgi:hypothetical protein
VSVRTRQLVANFCVPSAPPYLDLCAFPHNKEEKTQQQTAKNLKSLKQKKGENQKLVETLQPGRSPVRCEIGWRLLCNCEVPDVHALAKLIDWYRARWEIEMFVNVLKNACRVEALQLSADGARGEGARAV